MKKTLTFIYRKWKRCHNRCSFGPTLFESTNQCSIKSTQCEIDIDFSVEKFTMILFYFNFDSLRLFRESGIHERHHKRALNPDLKLEVDELSKHDEQVFITLNFDQFVGLFTLLSMLYFVSILIMILEILASIFRIHQTLSHLS